MDQQKRWRYSWKRAKLFLWNLASLASRRPVLLSAARAGDAVCSPEIATGSPSLRAGAPQHAACPILEPSAACNWKFAESCRNSLNRKLKLRKLVFKPAIFWRYTNIWLFDYYWVEYVELLVYILLTPARLSNRDIFIFNTDSRTPNFPWRWSMHLIRSYRSPSKREKMLLILTKWERLEKLRSLETTKSPLGSPEDRYLSRVNRCIPGTLGTACVSAWRWSE